MRNTCTIFSMVAPTRLLPATTKVASPSPCIHPHNRRSCFSYLLAAPAMFVWGMGTSNIFEDGFDFEQSTTAAFLAVGSIVIPAVDSFVNSQRVEQWNDRVSD